jgi:hypothetical protein
MGDQNKVVRITHDAKGELKISKEVELPSSPKSPKTGPYVAYEFQYTAAGHTTTYQMFMRSTYGVYNYVGALLHHHTDITNLSEDESGYGGMVQILRQAEVSRAADLGCFADVTYRKVRYCVPNSSDRTKRIFALLHELQQLNTAPSNAPTTLSTVSTPGP